MPLMSAKDLESGQVEWTGSSEYYRITGQDMHVINPVINPYVSHAEEVKPAKAGWYGIYH